MTKVDFYLLSAEGPESRERTACRLAEKAYRLGHRVYLLVPDQAAAIELDELLWTFSQGSFVPHAVCTDKADSDVPPVLIGYAEPPAALNDVLVSLSAEVPPWFSRFARVAELVGPAEADKNRARGRFRFYRERGYPLDTHNL
jgi:DNA polymerase-3 subunit chi